jgi:hypothetical protein
MSRGLDAFFYYADTPRRREALRLPPGAAARYVLYGLDQLGEHGISVRHNLDPPRRPPLWARLGGGAMTAALRAVRGTHGDTAEALSHLGAANRADVVLATIDRMGIPLTVLRRVHVLRPPLVYVSVGLVERLRRLRPTALALHVSALRRARALVAYSEHEAAQIRDAIAAPDAPLVAFVPFGADVEFFSPADDVPADLDVVSIGADPHRDYALLVRLARRHPEWSVRIVCSRDQARALRDVPPNVALDVEVPFAGVRDLLRRARVVALPVHDNSYSGAGLPGRRLRHRCHLVGVRPPGRRELPAHGARRRCGVRARDPRAVVRSGEGVTARSCRAAARRAAAHLAPLRRRDGRDHPPRGRLI